jgi:hypothetical protein
MKSDFRVCSGKRNPSTLIRRILTSPGVGCIVLVIIAAWIAQHYLGAIGGAEAMRARLGLSALLPLIVVHGGCHIANTAAGAAGVPLWRHLWCSAIGILPLAVIVAALGSGAAGMMSGG